MQLFSPNFSEAKPSCTEKYSFHKDVTDLVITWPCSFMQISHSLCDAKKTSLDPEEMGAQCKSDQMAGQSWHLARANVQRRGVGNLVGDLALGSCFIRPRHTMPLIRSFLPTNAIFDWFQSAESPLTRSSPNPSTPLVWLGVRFWLVRVTAQEGLVKNPGIHLWKWYS